MQVASVWLVGCFAALLLRVLGWAGVPVAGAASGYLLTVVGVAVVAGWAVFAGRRLSRRRRPPEPRGGGPILRATAERVLRPLIQDVSATGLVVTTIQIGLRDGAEPPAAVARTGSAAARTTIKTGLTDGAGPSATVAGAGRDAAGTERAGTPDTVPGRVRIDALAWGSPADLGPETVVEIGSITKALTGVLLAGLTLDGVVGLDQDVSELLPLPQLSGVTLTDLATHRSGLPRLPAGMLLRAWLRDPDPYRSFDESKLLASVPVPVPRAQAPALYSNLGFAVLGLALARAAGRPYDELLTERVLAPLGMAGTSFRARPARGHDRLGMPVKTWQFSAFAPAGGLRSTASDLARLATALLRPPDAPIGRALALSTEPRSAMGGGEIGLGWQLRDDLVWHNGATAGSYAWIGADRPAGTAAVLLIPSAPRPAFGDAVFGLLTS